MLSATINPVYKSSNIFFTGKNLSKGSNSCNCDIFQKSKEKKCQTRSIGKILFCHPGISRKTHLEEAKFIKAHNDLTLDANINFFEGIKSREFDINKLMLIAADNSLREKGNAYIFGEELPKIFKGMDKKEVADAITNLLQKDEIKSFKIGKKKFYASWVDAGATGGVYRISDFWGRSAALKHYDKDWSNYNNGLVEIACSKQMTCDGVTDVPKFYMANAADYNINKNKETYRAPMWLLTEYIKDNDHLKANPNSYKSWLEEYGLYHEDDIGTNLKNGFLVDLGGICHRRYNDERATSEVQYEILKNGLKQGLGVNGVINFYKNFLLGTIKHLGDDDA